MPSCAGAIGGEERIEADRPSCRARRPGGRPRGRCGPGRRRRASCRPAGCRRICCVPICLPEAGVGGGDVPGQGHQQGDGLLGGADGVAAGRVHDDDALARGGGDVDVVDADAGAHDGPQLAGILQQLARSPWCRCGRSCRRRPGPPGQGVPFQAVALVQLEACLAQQVEAGSFQFVTNENVPPWFTYHEKLQRNTRTDEPGERTGSLSSFMACYTASGFFDTPGNARWRNAPAPARR